MALRPPPAYILLWPGACIPPASAVPQVCGGNPFWLKGCAEAMGSPAGRPDAGGISKPLKRTWAVHVLGTAALLGLVRTQVFRSSRIIVSHEH